ncbi:hypothetical protein C8N40_111125 [Pontibacter mucosus]|uniref:Uncharacterized protein n=1 Tax=Pontibacter mucosus TaxID=1649266 RepID=A0A2T5YD67_9BACT|nr:hypothetical protein [Pontibacter mucosus]PTX14460.1 hypothetical protein C8N40_111125 [Pontibacter mucosus]
MHHSKGTALIQIGGKERPIYFGFMQSRIFCELRGKEYYEYLDEVNKAFGLKDNPIPDGLTEAERTQHIVRKMDMFIMADLVYSGLAAGCKHPDYRIKQDFTADDVCFWIEGMEPEEMGKVYATLLDANKSPNEPAQAAQEAPQTEAASA